MYTFFKLILTTTLVSCFYLSFTLVTESKGKLFIIGGGNRTTALMQRMVSESGIDKGGYAVVLPMSSEDPDTAYYYVNIDFKALGCNNVQKLFCTKAQANDPVKADSIRHAKLIYISGGDQSRFMDVVEGSAVLKAIRDAYQNGSMIAGTSAGAAVMSQIMITGNTLKGKEYAATFNTIEADNIETRDGLGMIRNAIIDQHFVKRSRHNRLITAIIEYPGMKGIGIDESTAILVKANDAEVVGESQVLVYANPLKSKSEKNGKLAAHGLTLDIYLPGEHFSLE
ncbi:MAG: cyanophycinase [Saprospiraceae bacterium]